MDTPKKRPIQLESYDIELINQTVAELANCVKQPWPESYCACESQIVEVMRIIQSRKYTSVRKQIKQQNHQVGRAIEDKEKAVLDAGGLLFVKHTQADDEIFEHLNGRLGPVPGYSFVIEACHGSEMDNLGKDIRRFRQSVSDLMTELQNVIERSDAGEAETEQWTNASAGKRGAKEKPTSETKSDSTPAQNINIENYVRMGNVQAENVQTGDHGTINKHAGIERNKKSIVRKVLEIIAAIFAFLAALLTCLYYLGWLEPIKVLIYKLFAQE
ncbi:MAG TPA: hypothetical protein DIU00_22485 [Phycisphaerales bacterium]|nr:hypothetical protein [Phycisphaerales bacterium]